jgi:superfamily II DNA/RNA helicase
MIVYDEADEIFMQESNQQCITNINAYFQKINLKPQFVLFSATFTDKVIECINNFFDHIEAFTV